MRVGSAVPDWRIIPLGSEWSDTSLPATLSTYRRSSGALPFWRGPNRWLTGRVEMHRRHAAFSEEVGDRAGRTIVDTRE